MKNEYRVVWKWGKHTRYDFDNNPYTFDPKPKNKRYLTRKGAERFMLLLGPAPWEYFKANPDDYVCCSGAMCACGGKTYREQAKEKHFADLEYLRLECREVGEWFGVTP